MAESKYRKCIITELAHRTEAPWTPVFKPDEMTRGLFLDSNVLKGAFYVETGWMLPPFADRKHTEAEAHKHNYDEVLAYFGADPKNPSKLYAEVEIPIGGEKYTINKSFILFIPKGVMHGPLNFRKIERPLFHFACGTGKKYYDED